MTAKSYPTPASESVSVRMRANGRRDTRPEIEVRRRLHGLGHRFFVDRTIRLPERRVRPDIVFPRRRLAVFIDGCFWHACPEHGTRPEWNAEYWTAKLKRNVERDRAVDQDLRAAGWLPLRYWEHERPEAVAAHIAAKINGRAPIRPGGQR